MPAVPPVSPDHPHEPAEPLDVSGYIRRSRRRADLSQRGLAAVIGVGQSDISRIEDGRRIDVHTFARILATAGLRLVVVDADGAEVAPMPSDVLRDRAGRRQPAHLDVHARPTPPTYRLLLRGVDPCPRESWHFRRRDRDRMRGVGGATAAPEQPTVRSVRAGRARAT